MLDRVGQKILCSDYPFILGNHFPKSVKYYILFDLNLHLINLKPISPLIATLLAQEGGSIWELDRPLSRPWEFTIILTNLATSMAVNALMTGLIALKIFKVYLEVKPTSVDRALDPLSSTAAAAQARVNRLRQIVFIIIESGMALLAIQMVNVVLTILLGVQHTNAHGLLDDLSLVLGIHSMLNVIIIRSVYFSTASFQICFT